MRQLISLVGFAGSGKDTVADYLIDHRGFVALSFADALKDALAAILCWDRDLLEGETKESRIWRETVDTWWAERLGIPNFTPRWAMQNFGTEVMRKHFHAEVWILNVERRLNNLPEDQPVVIVDGRFPNELALGRRKGGHIIRVKRGPEPKWYGLALAANMGETDAREQMRALGIHESEWAWIGVSIDETIENHGDGIERLHAQIEHQCLLPKLVGAA